MDWSAGIRIKESKKPLSSSQWALLERAVQYGSARTVTKPEWQIATRTLVVRGLISILKVGEWTLEIKPTEAGIALIKDGQYKNEAVSTGSALGMASGCGRHYPKHNA